MRVPEDPAVGSARQDLANTSHHFSGSLSHVFACFPRAAGGVTHRLHVKAHTESMFLHVPFQAVFAELCGMLASSTN